MALAKSKDTAATAIPARALPTAEGRIVALDALRGAATCLGVCLHAAVSYMNGRMPGLVWVIHDGATSLFFDGLFWWLHSFRLPLFFFLAGFFAAMLEGARGARGLLAHRARRVLVPFLAGCLLILPISFYVWATGWMVSGRCSLKEVLAIKFGPAIQSELYGPLHLWFLEDLLLLTLAWCAIRWVAGWIKGPKGRGACLRTCPTPRPWLALTLPLWLSVPTALILAANVAPVVAHRNSFLPDGWRLLYYGAYFVAGAVLHHGRHALGDAFRYWGAHLALSVPASVGMLVFLERHLAGEAGWGDRVGLAAALSLVAWLSLFGLLGLGLRCLSAERRAWRYLADASYWVYLCHLPLVGLIQLDLEGAPLPAGLKFVVVVGLTAGLSLASYQTLVRHTFVGACLHGRRARA